MLLARSMPTVVISMGWLLHERGCCFDSDHILAPRCRQSEREPSTPSALLASLLRSRQAAFGQTTPRRVAKARRTGHSASRPLRTERPVRLGHADEDQRPRFAMGQPFTDHHSLL